MSKAFDQLVVLMERLRSETGCPWDRAQTPESLKPFLIEEAYEVLEAIESGKAEPLCEELGDLLFQVLFHAQIAAERKQFDIEAVLKRSHEKMTRRHPHVFSPEKTTSPPIDGKTVLARWEEMKKKERGNQSRKSALEGIPNQLPALLRAHQIQARAARVGFDWKTIEPVFDKVEEELEELRVAMAEGVPSRIEAELGDLLFAVVNAGRFLNVNAEDALRGTIRRFTDRFQAMETETARRGVSFESLSLEEMDLLWEEAKRNEKEER
ncbi:MAG: nucleoside triphosphate pyrophosphohydrolase [Candidatus Manganitrophaceae bacterium]